MRVLLDHGAPAPLRHHFPGHDALEAATIDGGRLSSGKLLAAAEADWQFQLSLAYGTLQAGGKLSPTRLLRFALHCSTSEHEL